MPPADAGALPFAQASSGRPVGHRVLHNGLESRGEPKPVGRHTIFRIASMTKPIAAVGALLLVEECRLRLDDPVEDLLPDLSDRRVLVDGRGPIDGETVPAHRPITLP